MFGSSQDRLAFSQAAVGVGSLPACHARCSLIKIEKYTELLKYMVFVGPFLPTTHQLSESKVAKLDPLRPFLGFPSVIILRGTV